MAQVPPTPQDADKAKAPHAQRPAPDWGRMVRVWAALVAAMTVAAMIFWAAMPRPRAAAPPATTDPGALRETVWPKEMAPSRAWRYIVIHHSATPVGTLEAIDQTHRDRGFVNGVAYHFLINNGRSPGTADGQIVPTRRWVDQLDGAHTKVRDHPEFNTEGVGICLIGNFDQHEPTPAQMAALEMLVLALRERYRIPLEHIAGHGELKNTRCPGRLFPMETFLMDLRDEHLKRLRSPVSSETE
ncbi:MAG: N-acetylmuramoyl-L-alanine amidase [Planctomycetes bacterium]|nr:N-acetylmuramoyl-L-alanine amidase [Planctomycetota bacterium]